MLKAAGIKPMLKGIAVLAASMVAAAAGAAGAWTEQEISNGELRATLTLPGTPDPFPAALIIAGSGPVDRDGNLPGAPNDSQKLLAHGLALQGIASLRADKRGIGGSGAAGTREEDLRFGTYVADAASWLKLLSGDSRLSRVALIGHSEGALVATLVAEQADLAGLILIAGASEPAARLIERQFAAADVPVSLRETSRRIAASLEKGEPVADVPSELAALYRPSLQNYLMSWFPLDPARELAKVSCPVLIVQGTTDLQVTVLDAQRLAAARPASKLVLIEGMNHVLKEAPAQRSANLQIYLTPNVPLAPALVPAIATFLQQP
jgi:pimeloyl-ACP methyl ester carboxylesterase